MKTIIGRCLLVAFVLLPPSATAGIAVIVHPSVTVPALTAEEVGQLFAGRTKSLPDGTAVAPVDLAEGSPLRVQFAERVLGKSEQQLRSYWTRMVFTGKGQPPRSVSGTPDMLKLVGSTPGFIGYVDSKDVATGKVKVLYLLK